MPLKVKDRPVPTGISLVSVTWEKQPDGTYIWTHTPGPVAQTKWSAIWCAGFNLDPDGTKHYHHLEGIQCHCPPGPHALAADSQAYEIALGGGRGSGKSTDTFGFLIKGNPISPGQPGITPIDVTYLNCPEYSFLVLRKNAKDLKDYYERAKRFFGMFAGQCSENPMGVKFPSGAWGIFDHLADEDAYEKYQGVEFVRLVGEEIGQISTEERYLKVLMSCRTSHPQMNAQAMLTFNPGGVGSQWVNDRFVNRAKWGRLYSPPESPKKKRIFFFSTVEDNPYQLVKEYDKSLDLLKISQPTLYRRWRFGDFTAIEGQYFEEFRSKRMEGEPESALHVVPVDSVPLPYWYFRWLAMDVGFAHDTSIGKYLNNDDDGRIYKYGEIVKSQTPYDELGMELAKWVQDDLERLPGHSMPLVISPDAFNKTDGNKTRAEQVASGIRKVLGDGSCFLVQLTEVEKQMAKAEAWASMQRRFEQLDGQLMIPIFRATDDRIAGWSYMHQLFRWVTSHPMPKADEDFARSLMVLPNGVDKYQQYMKRFQNQERDILPKMRILSNCPRTIRSLTNLMVDPNRPEDALKAAGDDSADETRYGCMYHSDRLSQKPLGIYLGERMAKAHERGIDIDDPTVRVQVARRVIEQYGAQVESNPFATIQRAGRHSRWRV